MKGTHYACCFVAACWSPDPVLRAHVEARPLCYTLVTCLQCPAVQVLNSMYAQTGATFTLVSTDRTTNAAWYTAAQNSSEWRAMTNALHKGGVQVPYHLHERLHACLSRLLGHALASADQLAPTSSRTAQDLNLYCQKLPLPLLGFSQFPWSYAKEPKQVRLRGPR